MSENQINKKEPQKGPGEVSTDLWKLLRFAANGESPEDHVNRHGPTNIEKGFVQGIPG